MFETVISLLSIVQNSLQKRHTILYAGFRWVAWREFLSLLSTFENSFEFTEILFDKSKFLLFEVYVRVKETAAAPNRIYFLHKCIINIARSRYLCTTAKMSKLLLPSIPNLAATGKTPIPCNAKNAALCSASCLVAAKSPTPPYWWPPHTTLLMKPPFSWNVL